MVDLKGRRRSQRASLIPMLARDTAQSGVELCAPVRKMLVW
jgi:hypothetical protein